MGNDEKVSGGPMNEITDLLKSNGYSVVEGRDAVLELIEDTSDGSENKLCSGYGVFPDGSKCAGCPDCSKEAR